MFNVCVTVDNSNATLETGSPQQQNRPVRAWTVHAGNQSVVNTNNILHSAGHQLLESVPYYWAPVGHYFILRYKNLFQKDIRIVQN